MALFNIDLVILIVVMVTMIILMLKESHNNSPTSLATVQKKKKSGGFQSMGETFLSLNVGSLIGFYHRNANLHATF